MERSCLDNNPKIVKRIYDWDGKRIEFNLCNSHLTDPDFSGYVKEEKLQ